MSEGEYVRFSLKRKERHVVLDDPETGREESYVLRELTGRGRDEYLNNINSRMRPDNQGGGMKTIVGIQSSLIAASMFKLGSNGMETQLKIGEVEKFPASVTTELYEMCRQISSLGDTTEDAEDSAKND